MKPSSKTILQGFKLSGPLCVIVVALALSIVLIPSLAQPQADASKLLDQLVLGAKKEQELVIGWPGSITPGRESKANEAFNRQFGLNIRFAGSQKESTDTAAEAIMETRQRLSPTYDVLEMPDVRAPVLITAGAAEKIQKWEALLKALDSTVKTHFVSPAGPLQHYAFAWSHRQKVLIYNPKIIQQRELPQTLLEMGDPKFKGKFSLPPWVSEVQFGILIYSKDKWLETVKGMGRNSAGSYRYTEGIQRMFLGEFPFLLANADYYWRFKKQDPNAPIGVAFFKDLNFLSYSVYLIRQGSRSPNAATLFTLWAATSEANKIWEDEFGQSGSLALPSSRAGSQLEKMLSETNAKLTSYWDTPKGVETVNFYTTAEGKQYANALGRAIKGR